MALLEIGSVCIKTCGKEAGEKAVILEIINDKQVMVIGSKVKKRKCNKAHLVPIGEKISVTKSITQKELQKLE